MADCDSDAPNELADKHGEGAVLYAIGLELLAAKTGSPNACIPTGVRHTHASELSQEGFDIGIISKRLRHRDISTTARDLDPTAQRAVANAVRESVG